MKKTLLSLTFVIGMSVLQNAHAQLSFSTAVNYSVGTNPASVISADFNGDGKSDLAVANSTSNDLSILLGSGTGTFSAAVNYSVGTSPKSVISGDFNNDGKIDLATANQSSNDVSILLGSGTGTFSAAVSYIAGTGAKGIISADFNGDSNTDLAVANNTAGNVSILFGSGTGTFSAAVNYATGSTPWSVAFADFNGDSNADLVVVNGGSNNVSILLGSVTGTFSPAINYGVSTNPRGVVTGDFNTDGKTDIAVSNLSFNDVSILLGTGVGTFSTAVNYGVGGTFPISITSADYDIDGFIDLATTNSSSGNVSILHGTGVGTFTAVATYNTGTNAFSGASVDFNGDGKVDLAVANSGSNNLSILINTSMPLVPTANFLISNPKCIGAAINFTDKSTYFPTSWVWSFPGGTPTSSTIQNPIVTYTAAGTYSAVLTASNGIGPSTPLTQTFAVNALPAVSAGIDNTICFGASNINSASGANTYTWNPGNFVGSNQNVTPLSTTTYTVIGTNTITGCTNSDQMIVYVNALPIANAGPSRTLTCVNTSTTLAGSGTGIPSYSWNGPGIVSGATTANPTINLPGVYSLTVTSGGCTSVPSTVTISQNTVSPSPTASTSGTLTCTTLTVPLTGSPGTGVTYLWSGPGVSGSTTTQNTSANAPGIYTLTVVSSINGCSASATAAVMQNVTPPTASATHSGTLTCTVANLSLTGTGGGTYNWSGPGIAAGATTANPVITLPGCYNLTVTAANSCIATATTCVTQNTSTPNANAGADQSLTCASPTVTLSGSASPSSCTPVWTGGVSSGSNSYNATATTVGDYTLNVTNPANGCSATDIVQVTANAGIPPLSTSVTNILDCTNTTATIVATTTITTVMYSWTGPGIVSGASTASATVNQPGSYSVTVTNTTTGCSSMATVIAPQNTVAPSMSVLATPSLICSGGTATLTASGANSYLWDSGATTNVISVSPSSSTTYTVTGTDPNGCSVSMTQNVTVNSTPTITVSGNINICNGSTTTLTGSGATSYTWDSGANTTTISVTPTITTTYTLNGDNGNGCSSSLPITVSIIPNKSITGIITSTAGATGGDIIIYKYTAALSHWDSLTITPIGGTYSFNNIDSGLYVLRAIPTATDVQVTYAPNAISWQGATIINHGCTNNTSQNIDLIGFAPYIVGPGILTGQIVEAFGYVPRMSNESKPLFPGQPIGGIIVKGGKNPGGQMLVQTMTDASGNYTLTGLPVNTLPDDYFIFVDIPGLDTNGTYHISIASGTSTITGLDFNVDAQYINPIGSVTAISNDNSILKNKILLFPNPASQKFTLEYELIQSANVQIELYDVIGHKVKTVTQNSFEEKNKYSYSVNLEDLSTGVYFVKLKINNSETTIKLIVTN